MRDDHLDGLSYRKIACKYSISKSRAHRIVIQELKKLPDNNKFTHKYCGRFSNILVVDAKYINIRGYDRKQAFLWGVDYHKHDFPIITLAKSESYQAWSRYFFFFRLIKQPELVICDDHTNIKDSARKNFPRVKIQICYTHLVRGLERDLKTATEPTYRDFVDRIKFVFSKKRSTKDFEFQMARIFDFYKSDPVLLHKLMRINNLRDEYLAFQGFRRAPVTTNMIEGFNSHLEARLKALHHFHDFKHAQLWLNGYVLKRRFTPFASCKGKFKHLNGCKPLDQSQKKDIDLPTFF